MITNLRRTVCQLSLGNHRERRFPISRALVIATVAFAASATHGYAASCPAAWNASQVYTGGAQASKNNIAYRANWWTQGNDPATNSGGAGSGQPWTSLGNCQATTPPTNPPTTPPSGASMQGRLFAPYIDMGLLTSANLPAIQSASGTKIFTLGFIVSQGACAPSWGGIGAINSDILPNGTSMKTLIDSIRTNGGNVIISFGGLSGAELGQSCTSVSSLQAAYQAVINRYGAVALDFDIEGGAATDSASIDRRNQALVRLRAANPGLVISYTLPMLPSGLVDSGVSLLQSAKRSGLAVDLVNIMAMNYGAAVANPNAMGANAIAAANATITQVNAAGLTSKVGITPMIGVNDVRPEIFTVADAQRVLTYALGNARIGRVAMWSVGRDNGSCAGNAYADSGCSGLAQSAYQFSKIFQGFE